MALSQALKELLSMRRLLPLLFVAAALFAGDGRKMVAEAALKGAEAPLVSAQMLDLNGGPCSYHIHVIRN